ncbi:syncytin-1-like [Mesoplodon densirostris]|uniref:syncytin-1-like n=1 Tax=Mesoplodon densirostris TaxID=48708 RepID=UPI0028DC62D2|nr:syncytin-1-like [Mesoplodon densirostris]XP_059966875.1 syncytin-1-like [Mesoplodon densirostris]
MAPGLEDPHHPHRAQGNATGSGPRRGTLTHSVSTSRDLEHKLQLAIEASAASISSLQCQITSIARVALQNRRALDLLTADKGGSFGGAWRKSLGWPQTKCSSVLTPCFLQNPPLVSPKPRTSGRPTLLSTPPFSMK